MYSDSDGGSYRTSPDTTPHLYQRNSGMVFSLPMEYNLCNPCIFCLHGQHAYPIYQLFPHILLCHGIYIGGLLALILTTPAQFWVGAKFYRSAYKSLRHGSSMMDVLVMLGTSATYLYSLVSMILAVFNDDPDFCLFLFFKMSTMLITFVSLGRFLENMAKGRTSAALTDLMSLAPSMATIYTNVPACTQEKKIATELIAVDTVRLVLGDKVPVDGTVIKGSSTVDESAITGEAFNPVLKQVGDL
jgi:Cu+-exporting ATPase